ncbi:MAG: hypothetical protein HQL12_03250 [Candidatus Omnitrophica bacterium]|nr:hypothetical protein [Candidatus Omnitrophota bacterium]
MRFYKFIIILLFLFWGIDAGAQVPAELSSMPQRWQMTLDLIKSKAQKLMIENNRLKVEYRQLIGQVEKLQQSIADQHSKNEQVELFLKERHGRTDQQLRIEELAQAIKIKKPRDRALDEQFLNLKKKQEALDHKIQLLNKTILDTGMHQQEGKEKSQAVQNRAPLQIDDRLTQWRKQLEDENKQEVLLANELEGLKASDKTPNLNVDAIVEENKRLEAHLDILRLQRSQHEKNFPDTQQAQANVRKYDMLKKRKDQLEADINAYETRLDELKETSLMALSWPLKKKKLIHEMVQADARNNQMRDKIKQLREDIDVLRDQVGRLEHRVDFVQGKDAKQ